MFSSARMMFGVLLLLLVTDSYACVYCCSRCCWSGAHAGGQACDWEPEFGCFVSGTCQGDPYPRGPNQTNLPLPFKFATLENCARSNDSNFTLTSYRESLVGDFVQVAAQPLNPTNPSEGQTFDSLVMPNAKPSEFYIIVSPANVRDVAAVDADMAYLLFRMARISRSPGFDGTGSATLTKVITQQDVEAKLQGKRAFTKPTQNTLKVAAYATDLVNADERKLIIIVQNKDAISEQPLEAARKMVVTLKKQAKEIDQVPTGTDTYVVTGWNVY